MLITAVAIGLLFAFILILRLFVSSEKNSKIVVRTECATPFVLEKMTETEAEFSSEVIFENVGGQFATIMDCFARPQLPFEQYDGVLPRGKVEVLGRSREDDYFEATLIGRHDKLTVLVKVTLTARKGMDIKSALSRMVDLPIDVVYTELGRRPWRLGKFRVVLTAEKISSLTGVALVDD